MKMNLKEKMGGSGLISASGQGPVEGCSEYGNEP
jgi:hypothetical protein